MTNPEINFNDLVQQTREKMRAGRKPEPASRKPAAAQSPEKSDAPLPLTTGWWRSKGGGPAHWLKEGKPLCGRVIYGDSPVTAASTDPANPEFQQNQCQKCKKAMQKAGSMVEQALTVQEPVASRQEPVHEVATPVLEVAAPEQTIQQPLHDPKMQLPGTPVLFPELALDSSPSQEEARENRSGVSPVLGRTTLPWNAIVRSTLNPRKAFDEDTLKELAINIKAKGLKQNLVVRPHPTEAGKYEIAAGERRWRAIGLLVQGFEHGEGEARDWLEVPADWPVPVLVEHLSDLELLEVATAENLQRRRMTPLEEADAFAAMIDQGGNPDDIASKFGYTKRTVVRRVQLARGLSEDLRDDFNAGKLTLSVAEVLAPLLPETQKAVWDNYRRNPDNYPADHVRKYLGTKLFQVADAQFPPTWYTGKLSEEDLFGDVPRHFLDAAQALELQIKHAQALAAKDVKNGASFADVKVGGMFCNWHYEGEGTGVAYTIESTTGKMTRNDHLGPRKPWVKVDHSVQGDTKHEALPSGGPQAPAPQPVKTTGYPSVHGTADTLLADLLIDSAVSNEHLFNALFVADSLTQEFPLFALPSANQAMQLVMDLNVIDADDNVESGVTPTELVRHLLTLPEDAVKVLAQGYMAGSLSNGICANAHETLKLATEHHKPFHLTADYLKACDDQAIKEIWDDAEMGDREITKPAHLRKKLLEEAPRLAEKGFLPRPLRAEETE